jgi:hypothetical protein
MNRPISTKTHGMIDYSWSAAATLVPQAIDDAPQTARLMRGAGMAATASSMMTNYEAGLVRVMPMKGHLAVDFVMNAMLVASPWFLPRSERRYAAIPVAFGAMGLITGLMTQTRSTTEMTASGFTPAASH